MKITIFKTSLPPSDREDGKISAGKITQHLQFLSDGIDTLVRIDGDNSVKYNLIIEKDQGIDFFRWLSSDNGSVGTYFYEIDPDLSVEAEKFIKQLSEREVSAEDKLPSPSESHTFYLVWKRGNGGKTPRYRHPNKNSALSEAERLSLKYPESKIYVLEAVAKFINGKRVDYPVPNVEPTAYVEPFELPLVQQTNPNACGYCGEILTFLWGPQERQQKTCSTCRSTYSYPDGKPGAEVEANNKYGVGKWHCDDILVARSASEFVLDFLDIERSPAHGMGREKVPLYATYENKPCRVTMASRFGDIGITFDLQKEVGYDKRVLLPELVDLRTCP